MVCSEGGVFIGYYKDESSPAAVYHFENSYCVFAKNAPHSNYDYVYTDK